MMEPKDIPALLMSFSALLATLGNWAQNRAERRKEQGQKAKEGDLTRAQIQLETEKFFSERTVNFINELEGRLSVTNVITDQLRERLDRERAECEKKMQILAENAESRLKTVADRASKVTEILASMQSSQVEGQSHLLSILERVIELEEHKEEANRVRLRLDVVEDLLKKLKDVTREDEGSNGRPISESLGRSDSDQGVG